MTLKDQTTRATLTLCWKDKGPSFVLVCFGISTDGTSKIPEEILLSLKFLKPR
jgi:hypothetical protein